MMELSRAYEEGNGLQRDAEKAREWREEAAQAGNEEAIRLMNLGAETKPDEKITRWKRRQGIIRLEKPVRTPKLQFLCRYGVFMINTPVSAAALRRYMRYTQVDAGQRSSKPTGQRLV